WNGRVPVRESDQFECLQTKTPRLERLHYKRPSVREVRRCAFKRGGREQKLEQRHPHGEEKAGTGPGNPVLLPFARFPAFPVTDMHPSPYDGCQPCVVRNWKRCGIRRPGTAGGEECFFLQVR